MPDLVDAPLFDLPDGAHAPVEVRAYRYLESAAVDLQRINPAAAETAALIAVRLRPVAEAYENGENDE